MSQNINSENNISLFIEPVENLFLQTEISLLCKKMYCKKYKEHLFGKRFLETANKWAHENLSLKDFLTHEKQLLEDLSSLYIALSDRGS